MYCATCEKREKCVKPCQEVEKWLRDQGIYSSNYIRPEVDKEHRKDKEGKFREIPFSSIGINKDAEWTRREKY